MSIFIKTGFWIEKKIGFKEEFNLTRYITQLINQSPSSEIPVLTDYPTTEYTKAGQRFWYKGNEWNYMTANEISAIGWAVPVGFPAPVNKIYNIEIAYPDILFSATAYVDTLSNPSLNYSSVNILGFGNPKKLRMLQIRANATSFINVNLLTELQDVGTSVSVTFPSLNITAQTIDAFFTQLPITTKTATIRVSGNPGSATCTPSIATNKGYIVIT